MFKQNKNNIKIYLLLNSFETLYSLKMHLLMINRFFRQKITFVFFTFSKMKDNFYLLKELSKKIMRKNNVRIKSK